MRAVATENTIVFSYSIENQNVTNECGSNLFAVRNLLQKTNVNKIDDKELSRKCDSLQNIILLNEYYKDSVNSQSNDGSFINNEEINIRENDPKAAHWFDKNKEKLDINEIRANYYIYSNELKKRNYFAMNIGKSSSTTIETIIENLDKAIYIYKIH